jgi:hypothetical protein
LLPWAGFAFAAKPTLGAALFVAFPSRRALVSVLAVVFASIAVFPSWPILWIQTLHAASHMSAPVTHLWAGGPLILLSLIMEATRSATRRGFGMCATNHADLRSRAIFLVVDRCYEGLALAILTFVAGLWAPPTTAFNMSVWATGNVMVVSLTAVRAVRSIVPTSMQADSQRLASAPWRRASIAVV